jgi:pimeloyl-ACP methyl ester carboxylesterase
MFQERQLSGDDVPLNFAEGPQSGGPLVLLHGVVRCWQDFVPLMPALAARWHVHGLDFRGHGGSQPSPGAYLVTDYVRDAVHLISAHLTEPVVIYGHSLGAMVAAAVAAELPDRVRGLVLEDPPFDTMGSRIRQTSFHSYFAALFELVQRQLPDTVLARELAEMRVTTPGQTESVRLGSLRDAVALRFVARCCDTLDPEVLRPIVEGRWLNGYRRDEILRHITCPTLLLQADESAGGMLPDADAAEVLSLLADGLHIKFPGTGHLIHSQQTEAVLRHVQAFLESLPPLAGRGKLHHTNNRNSLA